MNDHLQRPPNHHRVLVVEDDEISRICLIALLAQMGYEVEEAKTGAQAIERIREHHFDLVLMDLHLPDGKAEEKLAEIQTLEKPLPPIFAVTTRVTAKKAEQLWQAGFTDYLLKPISVETLTAKTRHLTKPKQQVLQLSRQITHHLEHHLPVGIHLVRKLLAELPRQLKEVQSSLHHGRLEDATGLIHKLNGAAGFLGLSELRRQANNLEEALQGSNKSLQQSSWNDVKKEAQRLLALGDELLDTLTQEVNRNLSNRS